MPPPENGNEYIPFTQLIALERISQHCYRSKALAFGPANGNRTYGGHVYMQACYAAAQTVPKDMVLHNVTGWFVLAGKANERFIYTVRTIRDGGYSTRAVDVVQETGPGICFTCICSFKKPERPNVPSLDAQQQIELKSTYRSVLGDMRPDEHEEMPGIDAPWYWEYTRKNNGYTDPCPGALRNLMCFNPITSRCIREFVGLTKCAGLRLRKVNMDSYNKDLPPLERRNLKYYSVIGDMPSIKEDPNMHVCAHLYASDRNSLFVISNNFGVGDNYSSIASLAHTVIFHADAAEMDMTDAKTGEPRWFCQEAWAGGSRHGRGLHQSRIWTEDGLHVASTIQDGMVRLRTEDGQGKQGFAPRMTAGLEKGGNRNGKL